jgi:hypothetical protein
MTLESDSDREIPVSAVMYELKRIGDIQTEMNGTLDKILNELGGNGGPGIRTRIHSLEIGAGHTVNRFLAQEQKAKELDERQRDNERRILSMRNIGVGVVVALGVLEALRWIIPLLQAP